ncbi:MAG: general secretion pathway protein GspB [Oceanospirillaceae bacterium]|nr:general secretion pathway protein GspB [Oceanospirillaceae bacterium]
MSYILDALKQSDSKRKQETPSESGAAAIIAKPRKQPRSGGRLKWMLLLLVVVVVLVWWQRMPDLGPESGAQTPTEATESEVASTQTNATEESSNGNPVDQTLAVVAPAAVNEDDLKGVRIRLEEPVAAPAPKPAVRRDAPVIAAAKTESGPTLPDVETSPVAAKPASPYADIPYWRQLPVDVQRSLPELKFSVHIYSDDPALRRVKVGERMLREGQIITQDVRLVAIIPKGVILSKREYRFRMNAL